MTRMLRNSKVLLATLLVVVSSAVRADVTAVPNPPTTTITLSPLGSFGPPSTITITWTVTSTVCAGAGTVSSPNGTILIGATTISTAGGTLSAPVTVPGSPTAVFTETVSIPQSVSVQAVQSGLNAATFRRVWNTSIPCTSSTGTVNVPLPVTSATTAAFNVTRMALLFDNGAPVRVIENRRPLRAVADINFSGNGLLQGVWEVASPPSTAGEPIFRPLASVRQFLTGSVVHRLESPNLPTDITGLYLLRLRVTDPTLPFDTPVIRYFVSEEPAKTKAPAAPLGLVSPPNQIMIAPDTMFAWEPIRGARAYQLEIYAKPRMPGDTLPDLGSDATALPPALPSTPPVTGMLVAGAQTRAALSATARSHLVSGQAYLWRVLAIGTDGTVVGESPVRELRMP